MKCSVVMWLNSVEKVEILNSAKNCKTVKNYNHNINILPKRNDKQSIT